MVHDVFQRDLVLFSQLTAHGVSGTEDDTPYKPTME